MNIETFTFNKTPDNENWETAISDLGLAITRPAFQAMREALAAEEDKTQMLRLGVKGGGCSGFMYLMEFTTEIDPEEDYVREIDGFKIVIDELSAGYLVNVTLDHVKTLKESGFKFINKKPGVRHCGCGSSFSG